MVITAKSDKKYLKFKAITRFVWLACLLFLTSCTHQKDESIIGLSELSLPYSKTINSNQLIKLNYYELAPYLTNKGFVWDSFNLPIVSDSKVLESDLLVGYAIDQDNFVFPPQNGSCKIIQKPGKNENRQKKLISFISANPYPEEDAGTLFLLLDKDDFMPYALVKLNKFGSAKCYLPNSTYQLSYNFGSHRKDFSINLDDKNNLVQIEFEKKGLLRIEPIEINHVQNGDLIRIGRKTEIKNSPPNLKNTLIPVQIEGDLFKQSNFQSQSLNVSETFQSTFLIGKSPFNVQLDAGSYVIAVVRKNNVVCLKEIEIQEGVPINLLCPKGQNKDAEERIFNKNLFRFTFDATFFPERLTQDTHFQDWFLLNNMSYMPILSTETKKNTTSQDEKLFSFIFHQNLYASTRQFPENFDLKIDDNSSLFPVFGTSMENLVKGAIPFSKFTNVQFQNPLEPSQFLMGSYLNVTNGTDIILFEPFLTNGELLTNIVEQRFRFRIFVPKWNSTNVVEMNIDGKLHKRWILNRGDLSQPFSITLDEKTFQEKDFTVRFTAWGAEPLPDFIYGTDGQIPYTRTRDYFVTIAGK
ncbi:MAG: hypothetical protein V4591_08220 [Bdellovibrionota bacterium]